VVALAGEHFQTADLLRRNGADPDVRGQSGTNRLHCAADSGNFEVVRILIEYYRDDPAFRFIDARDGTGWTPFHWVSQGSNFNDGPVLRLLLEHGADINAQNRNGWTLLQVA
jgi:ankyrin